MTPKQIAIKIESVDRNNELICHHFRHDNELWYNFETVLSSNRVIFYPPYKIKCIYFRKARIIETYPGRHKSLLVEFIAYLSLNDETVIQDKNVIFPIDLFTNFTQAKFRSFMYRFKKEQDQFNIKTFKSKILDLCESHNIEMDKIVDLFNNLSLEG